MKTTLALAATAGALFAAPALAGSPATDAFIANARPNVVFLDESSRIALDRSPSRAVRAFAHSEAREQTITANSMTAWVQTNTPRGEVAALGGLPIAGGVVAAPLDVAANVTNGVGDLVTGRSVGIDSPLTVTPASSAPVGSQLLPAGQDDLARLSKLSGRQFDVLYKATQVDALRQLAVLYRDYAANGDDPALRAIAARELPRVNARIARVDRL